jgi:hypothetical protein
MNLETLNPSSSSSSSSSPFPKREKSELN